MGAGWKQAGSRLGRAGWEQARVGWEQVGGSRLGAGCQQVGEQVGSRLGVGWGAGWEQAGVGWEQWEQAGNSLEAGWCKLGAGWEQAGVSWEQDRSRLGLVLAQIGSRL